MFSPKRPMLGSLLMTTGTVIFFWASAPHASAQNYTEWVGTGTNWNTSSNWNPNSTPNTRYGQLEWKGGGSTTSNNDLTNLAMWRFYFSGTKAYQLTGNSVNLFDFGSAHSWILSDSTVTQTISLNVNFAATVGDSFGQISARNTGDLVMNTVGITGTQVVQMRVAGNAAGTSTGKVIFNGAISGTGKGVVIGITETGAAATSTDVVFKAANTYSGDTFVNAGSLSFDGTGTSNSSAIRLGDISGTNAATIRLIKSDGGQTFNSILNPRAGTSGLLTLSSQNTSGTNTWAGNIFLDNNLTVSQSTGGTLSISNATLDLKNQTLALTGGGNIGITGIIGNSTGSGQVTIGVNGVVGGPTVTYSSANTYSGQTFVRAGTLAFNAGASAANSTIRLGSTSGTSVNASINLVTAGGGTTLTSTINPVATSGSGTLSINSQNTSGTNTLAGHLGLDRSLAITQAAGGTLNLTQTKGVDNTTGTDIKGHTLTLTSASTGTINHSGTIYNSTGSGSVTAGGSGTVVLSGANTYTGTTAVTNGTLLVNGNNSAATGAVSVAAAATLGGNGTVGGATTLAGTSIHAPGSAVATVGKQTFSSSVTYNSGSIFEWNLASTPATTGRGTNYDAVNAASLGATSGAIFRVVLNGAQDFSDAFWNTTRTWSDIFKTGDAGSNLSIASIFTGTTQYYNVSSGVLTGIPVTQGSFSFSGSNLIWTPIPEPTSALAGLLLTAGLLRRRRA